MKLLSFRVVRRIEETTDACSFELKAEDGPPEYRPGQYLSLRVPHPDGPLFRCYSLSSAPVLGEPMRITVKREPGGRASNWLCDRLGPGDVLQSLPPAGEFVPPSWGEDLLLFAGGSGITPVFAILKSALAEGRGRVRLVYANRGPEAVIFANELDDWRRRYPARLSVVHWLDRERGHPSPAALAALAGGWARARCFICGPAPYMACARAALAQIGVPAGRIHLESFSGEAPAAEADDDTAGEMAALSTEIRGQTVTVACPYRSFLLDALLGAGANVPSSCRAGNCGTCMCRVLEGEVALAENSVLEDEDVAEGWTLACRARPRSPKVRISFSG